jgi:HK97 family phage prohead protease
MERRFTTQPVSIIKRAEGDPPKIGGYAAVYYDGTEATEYELWDYAGERAVERIMPGAFSQAMSRPDDCRCLFNHDPNMVLGRTAAGTTALAIDGKGLQYETTPGDTMCAKDVQEHLRRKDVTGSSFSFAVDEERWTETKQPDGKWFSVREILSVTLYDVGPVTFPAYETTTSGMRSAGEADEARESLKSFREHRANGESSLRAKLNQYATRARLVEIGG